MATSLIPICVPSVVAGLPSDLLVEAHGTFASATCTACGRGYALDDIRLQMARGRVPYCANEDCAVRSVTLGRNSVLNGFRFHTRVYFFMLGV